MELNADIQREIQQQFKNSYAQLLADITRIYEQGAMRDALTGLYNKQAFERDSSTNHWLRWYPFRRHQWSEIYQ